MSTPATAAKSRADHHGQDQAARGPAGRRRSAERMASDNAGEGAHAHESGVAQAQLAGDADGQVQATRP